MSFMVMVQGDEERWERTRQTNVYTWQRKMRGTLTSLSWRAASVLWSAGKPSRVLAMPTGQAVEGPTPLCCIMRSWNLTLSSVKHVCEAIIFMICSGVYFMLAGGSNVAKSSRYTVFSLVLRYQSKMAVTRIVLRARVSASRRSTSTVVVS